MGVQFSQYHRYFNIPWDGQNTKKTQKKDVQRPQKQQYADCMRNASSWEKRSRRVYKISQIRSVTFSLRESQKIRKKHERGVQITQEQRYTDSIRNSRIYRKPTAEVCTIQSISVVLQHPMRGNRIHENHKKGCTKDSGTLSP